MAQSKDNINFLNVIKYFKGYSHQVKALEELAKSLSKSQIDLFYKYWYADTIRPDNTPKIYTNNYFDMAYAFTKKWEGGYVNHPNDPGGATNYGIIQSVYTEWRESKGLQYQHVSYMTPDEAETIFYENYWLATKCDEVGLPLNIVLFDTAVNFGVRGAVIFVQETLGIKLDGIWGPITDNAVKSSNPKDLAYVIIKNRVKYRYYRVETDPSQSVFLQGWLNRDNDLYNYIYEICKNNNCNN
jgi:lysozyme family protein